MPAPALVLASITSLQLGAAVAKSLFGQVGALGVVTLRIGGAAALLLALSRPRLPAPAALGPIAVLGLVLAGMNLAFYEAIARLPLGVAVTLELLGPLLVGVALSRRPVDLLWTLLALAGVALLTADRGRLPVDGIALALLAAALRGSYVVLTRLVGRRTPGGGDLALALAVGALALVPVGVARVGAALFDLPVLALGLAVAALSSALPYTLDLAALRRLPAVTFGVLVSLSPAVAAVVGTLALGERLAASQWGGVALVVLAAAGVTRSAR